MLALCGSGVESEKSEGRGENAEDEFEGERGGVGNEAAKSVESKRASASKLMLGISLDRPMAESCFALRSSCDGRILG